jgi:hypothetical protein
MTNSRLARSARATLWQLLPLLRALARTRTLTEFAVRPPERTLRVAPPPAVEPTFCGRSPAWRERREFRASITHWRLSSPLERFVFALDSFGRSLVFAHLISLAAEAHGEFRDDNLQRAPAAHGIFFIGSSSPVSSFFHSYSHHP